MKKSEGTRMTGAGGRGRGGAPQQAGLCGEVLNRVARGGGLANGLEREGRACGGWWFVASLLWSPSRLGAGTSHGGGQVELWNGHGALDGVQVALANTHAEAPPKLLHPFLEGHAAARNATRGLLPVREQFRKPLPPCALAHDRPRLRSSESDWRYGRCRDGCGGHVGRQENGAFSSDPSFLLITLALRMKKKYLTRHLCKIFRKRTISNSYFFILI